MPHDPRFAAIRLLLLDVDGVLTDGSIIFADDGAELKRFHVRDGTGLKLWREAGMGTAIVSGRRCPAVDRRAAELGISAVLQGRDDKRPALAELLARFELTAEQVCAIGDDLADLPVLRRCGLKVAVADAAAELKAVADYVTRTPGGRGAVRETIEWLMAGQGTWAAALARYAADDAS